MLWLYSISYQALLILITSQNNAPHDETPPNVFRCVPIIMLQLDFGLNVIELYDQLLHVTVHRLHPVIYQCLCNHIDLRKWVIIFGDLGGAEENRGN